MFSLKTMKAVHARKAQQGKSTAYVQKKLPF
jgi:hypothetical protein